MIKLMIVDDSNIIRGKIRRAQENTQFDVVAVAENGEDALRAFQLNRPAVVTMDLTMPKLDGIECISALVNIDPSVKILVISALSDKDTGIEALQRGACGFLLKPFSEAQLKDALIDISEGLDV